MTAASFPACQCFGYLDVSQLGNCAIILVSELLRLTGPRPTATTLHFGLLDALLRCLDLPLVEDPGISAARPFAFLCDTWSTFPFKLPSSLSIFRRIKWGISSPCLSRKRTIFMYSKYIHSIYDMRRSKIANDTQEYLGQASLTY